MSSILTLDDLMKMDGRGHHEVLARAHPLDPERLVGRQFLGVDLSLPDWVRKLLWHTFRKTFVRDEATGDVRGWNVRMEQHGVDGARIPMKDRLGRPITFGHYRLRSAQGLSFPTGWKGHHFLNYGVAGNTFLDVARIGRTPIVAVNEGSSELLLGWEVMQVAGAKLPLPLYWALRDEGPLELVVPPPRAVRP